MLGEQDQANPTLDTLIAAREQALDSASHKLLEQWPAIRESYSGDEYVVHIRDREIRTELKYQTLSGSSIPKVSLPDYEDHGELLKWLLLENLPGSFPFTAGVFAFKREGEDPTRMFAGEGDAFRTNRRFKELSEHSAAKRLSTAFDSVTLYGCDPDERPDIYGKVGNSGVSIATLDDMKVLYDGFDLCNPTTSVSMTINGPAPIILAMYLNTAIDQQLERFDSENERAPTDAGDRQDSRLGAGKHPRHGAGRYPQGRPGAEHLHLFHRVCAQDDGRYPAVFHRSPHSQLLLGVDFRLPHRRSRRQPDLAARLHPRQRFHLRRDLPRARHAHRRLCAQPVVLLQQRHGSGIHGHGPRRAAHLGDGDARSSTAPTSAARNSSITSRLPAARCTPRKWISTISAPRCRR